MSRTANLLLGALCCLVVACSAPDLPVASALPIDSIVALGDKAYADEAYDKARVLWRQAVTRAHAANDTVREARIGTSLGLAAWRLGDLQEARSLGEQALALKLRAGLHGELFRSYNALGLLANDAGRFEDALDLYARALAVADPKDSASVAKVANNRGLVQFAIGDYAAARAGFLEARRLGRKLGDARIEGRALDNLAMYGAQLGDPQTALTALVEARQLMRSDGDRVGEQNALGQMGAAYDALGEPQLALAAMDSALELSRALGLRQEEADNLELIANLHRQAGDLPRALDLYLQANRINEALGQTGEVATNLRSVAEIHAATGRFDLALAKAGDGLAIHRATGLRLEELRDEILLADLASMSRAGQPVVEAHLRAADRLSAALDARVARVEVALAKARIAGRRGDARVVLGVLDVARVDLARGGFGGEWQAAASRARAYAALGRLDSAVIAGKAAVGALERVRGEFGSSVLRSSFALDKAAPYTDLVDVLLRLDRTREAFEISDGVRRRALIEHLGASAADDDARLAPTVRALKAAEGMLRHIDALVLRRDSLDVPPNRRDSLSRRRALALAGELTRARDDYETRLLHAGDGDAAGSARLGERNTNVEKVQRALRPRESMLEYLVTPTRVITFVITRTDVRSVAADAPRENVIRWVRVARDLVGTARPASEPANDALTALYAVLIEPARRAGLLRDTERLIIVPHSVLSYVPFAALTQRARSRFLVEDYALLYFPSAQELVLTRNPVPRVTTSRARVFAPFPDALPASVREARAFHDAIPSSNVTVGPQATEAGFRAALAGDGVVHVATHGVMNPRNPMFSRLEFARGSGAPEDDGRLEVHELLGFRINAALVFLSGCETGIGTGAATAFTGGDDYATLAQAFLFAGARTVVATLWQIADEGGAAFAGAFYDHLQTARPAAALAAAQRDLLHGGKFAAPFYWAGYRVIGEDEFGPKTHSSLSAAVSRR